MLSTRFLKLAKPAKFTRLFCHVSKYSEDSIPGAIKEARRENEWIDVARFHSQNQNWTIKELDQHTAAFAYGLVERGYTPGDKLMLWVDDEHSAEVAVAQIGALKAGVSIISVDSKDSINHIGDTLDHSRAKGLLFSPHTKIDQNNQRANLLLELMPELIDHTSGQSLKVNNFPSLKNIIHTGHSTIRGTSKFKENMLYTNSNISTLRLPGTNGYAKAFEYYSKGEYATGISNREVLAKANEIWKKYLNDGDINLPVFLTLSLHTPLGFATFLSGIMNGRKVFVPSSYNMAKITKSFGFQRSDLLVCDEDLYKFEGPAHKVEEIAEHRAGFEKILVSTDTTGLSFSQYNEF